MSNIKHHPASFKDPSGFVFQMNNIIYRQVNQSYAKDYDLLMTSGLYTELINKKYLLTHTEIHENFTATADCYITLLPEQLAFISYPYEWCFAQLKDAALLTLKVQRIAIKYGMILKDATPFNVQFQNGSPVFIDTLSFEKYDVSRPWIAYRQFCECFLFPLYLQKYLQVDAQKLMIHYFEGIPAEVTKKLLPWKSKLNLGVWLHVNLQSQIKKDKKTSEHQSSFDQKKMISLVTNLEDSVKACVFTRASNSTWSNYYDETIISKTYLSEKEIIFRKLVNSTEFNTVLDIGANDGFFSKIISEKATSVVAIDFDSFCIDNLYEYTRKNKVSNILPLLIDFSNPTPALGFNNTERNSFFERAHFDLVLALALVHHLAISKNISLESIAASFQKIAKKIIVEFVDKNDIKIRELLKHKQDIYSTYSEENFEKAFGEYFSITKKIKIPGTHRTMYLLNCKED